MKKKLDKYLDQIVENLKKNYTPEKIILFGSYSKGNATEESDLDLILIKKTKKHPIWRRVEARKASKLKIPMDIIVYTPDEFEKLLKQNSFFIRDIVHSGKVLYEQK